MMYVGERIRRREDPGLLTGQSRFVADGPAGSLSACFVRSPLAAGTIGSIEFPSERMVFTAADLTDVAPIEPILHRPDYVRVPQSVLAGERVSYVGQPVAVALAATRQDAEDLAEQVWVSLSPIEPVIGIDGALGQGGQTHPGTPNVVIDGRVERGQVDRAVSEAAILVEFELRSRRQNATPLEARGANAVFDPGSGRVTLYASTQMPHVFRTVIADLLHIRESELRVVAPHVGGGFGQKMSLPPEYVVIVWLARHLRRSVAWIEDRRENLMSAFHSRDQRYRIKGAFDDAGRLLAIDADLVADVGAFSCYPVTWGVEPLMALAELPGPYDFQSYRVRSRAVTTNTCPMCPYRGVSRPVLTLAMERLMDQAARRLGLEPTEIRRRNLIRQFPYTSATGLTYDEGSYIESLETAIEKIDLPGFRDRQRAARADHRYLGIGFSVFGERTGYGTQAYAMRSMDVTPGYETAQLAMDPSGSIELRIGVSPHGQGLVTTLSQLVADELGVALDDVSVIHGDTDLTPYGWGTFASRSLVIAGGAAKLAAIEVGKRLSEIAGSMMEAAPEDIVLIGGRAVVRGTDQGMPIRDVARAAFHQSHRFAGNGAGLSASATYDPPGTYSNACHVAVVEVDVETGGVKIERFVVVSDAGVLVNPMIADGQVMGGVTQGIANALYEEVVYDDSGNILTTSFLDYLPPTISEVPRIEITHLCTVTDFSLTGAKGLGEGGAIGAPAAVINAIADALEPFGVEVLEMPATPDRILALLRQARHASG
jgi:carbon-monoxide dehydrogenase large subunit